MHSVAEEQFEEQLALGTTSGTFQMRKWRGPSGALK